MAEPVWRHQPCDKSPSKVLYKCEVDDWRWRTSDNLDNADISEDGLSVKLHPPSVDNWLGTAFGTKRLTPDIIAYWEVKLLNPTIRSGFYQHAGIASLECAADGLRRACYSVICADGHLREWYGCSTCFSTPRHALAYTPLTLANAETTIGVLFNGPEETVQFFNRGRSLDVKLELGYAFQPAVLCAAGTSTTATLQCAISRRVDLQDLCIATLKKQHMTASAIDGLTIPDSLKELLR